MAKNKNPARGAVPGSQNTPRTPLKPSVPSPGSPRSQPPIVPTPGSGSGSGSGSGTDPRMSAESKLSMKRDPVKKLAPVHFVFEKRNYQWMGIGIGVLALGFFLMAGTTDIMSNTKIVVAPCLILVGFGIEFYAILLNPAPKR